MVLKSAILPYQKNFPEILGSYIEQIKEAIRQKKHHDHRRSLFIDYLRQAFGVDPTEIEIEEKVKVANVKGNIDALYKYLIFEFKTDLIAEHQIAETELKKYFKSREKPEEYIALLTDGINFEVYQYENETLRKISDFCLNEREPLSSYRALDDLIFVSKKTTPTASDISSRFGPNSAIFNKTRSHLENLYQQASAKSAVQVKIGEWNSLLARVYGERIGDVSLFIKHTYLTVFSRLLIANAIFSARSRTKVFYKGIMTGRIFSKNNLVNIAEPDFFSWALDTEIEDSFIGIMAKIDKYLNSYNLDNVGEDILKEIYQELVDPESRHALGEYYTPDWIADIALDRLDYKNGKILDPACGSGTFLLAAIRKLRKLGYTETDLIETALSSVMGIDVHPLAVIMTKANILLALASELKELKKELYLPVYMSDTLLTSEDKRTESIAVAVSSDEEFRIPLKSTENGRNIDHLIDRLCDACRRAANGKEIKNRAWKGFKKNELNGISDNEIFLWRQNYRLMTKLIGEGRDTIWCFILKNAYRPAFIRLSKVDYVIGNPPWLAYRYIKDEGYKKKVKDLVFRHGLLDNKDVKLFTQMDISTLFFVFSIKYFLKAEGSIAFVLPKSTILPSKQHFNFQKIGFNEIHDFSGVEPLFNVRSVLVIKTSSKSKKEVPKFMYKGNLPTKNMSLDKASFFLEIKNEKHVFIKSLPQPSYYYNLFKQGATIVPRCFWFIQKDKEAAEHENIPYIETDESILKESKDRWRKKIDGRIEKRFIFRTILAKDLVPFGLKDFNEIFLPIIKQKKSFYLADTSVLLEKGYMNASAWLNETEIAWEKDRQSDDRNLIEWLNYNQKLVGQTIEAPFVLLYNTSGTHLACALYQPGLLKDKYFKTYGFAADSVTYYYYPKSKEEGLYLSALLNSRLINTAIKKFQPQGLFGERHIHRRPFEICTIPEFSANNPLHRELADLANDCRDKVADLLPHLKGSIGRIRTEVRKILKNELIKIDKVVERILIEAGQNSSLLKNAKKEIKNGDLFE